MPHTYSTQGSPATRGWLAIALALAIAIAMLVGAASAQATTLSYSGDNSTLIVTGGDNANHDLQFRLEQDGIFWDNVLDTVPFTSAPADCQVVSPNTWIRCPAHNGLRVDLGAGNDELNFDSQGFDCFDAYSLNLGDGDNELNLSDREECGTAIGGTATVTSGSGADVLRGGLQGPITFNSGGGNDSVHGSPGNDSMNGGEGDDRMFGVAGNDQVRGEGGADRPNGGPGNDLVDGGSGDDNLEYGEDSIGQNNDKGLGADTYAGGPGSDKLWLDGHDTGMAISIDGQANDGSAGEGDNVGSDIETFLGTVYDDDFSGGPAGESFDANGGNDRVHGGGGDDLIKGGDEDDQLFGDAGNDRVEGESGTDRVDGGPGADELFGDVSGCSVFCSPDIDSIFARDGEADLVNCGGPGSAQVDQLDVVGLCATVDRENVVVGGGGKPAKASFAGSKKSVKVNGKGRFSFSFRAGAGLSGKAVFKSAKKVQTSKRARVTLASKAFKVPASGKVTLKIKLSRKPLRILRRNRKIKTKVTVTLNGGGGSSKSSTTITLKR